ncbi:MAG: MgtC/SapB family protein, partial [Sagittula sp.]
TTGASLWLCGAIGLGCGAGSIALASMATGIVVVVLFVLGQVEKLIGTNNDA